MFEVFEIGPFLIWTRLVFLLLGIWLSIEFFLRLSQSAHLSLQHFREYALWYFGAFLLGGRIVALIGEYKVYVRDLLRIFIVWDGNFSFLGGAIGIGLVLFWVTRSSRATFLQWLDVLLPATMFGIAFDWLGQFASGHAYGKPTDLPWGVTYDTINVRYAVPLHPVQLYYAFFFFALTFILLIVRRHTLRAGAETLAGIILGSAATMWFENFRGDFGIPVFATLLDFVLLICLFVSLGVFALIELKLSQKMMIIYEVVMTALVIAYFIIRRFLTLETFELRFSQLLAVLVLLATIVYVIVHRRRYPHL